MKKILIILGLIVTAGVSSAFANGEKVSPRVLASFNSEFTSAQEVSWEAGENFYRASFTMNEQRVFAFFNTDGQLISVGRYISSVQLPINLFTELKNQYNSYWISDLFEISNEEGLHYYVTLETADTKLILRSSNAGSWTSYSKHKKA